MAGQQLRALFTDSQTLQGPGNKSKQLVKGADAEGTTANFKWKPVRLK